MKTIRLYDAWNTKNHELMVIDDVLEVNYDAQLNLLNKYSENGQVPIIMINAFRGCSMFYRLTTPFQIAKESHPVFRTAGFDNEGVKWNHEFHGSELVGKLFHPGESQIVHYENNQNNSYPDQKSECWNIVFGDYAVILPAEPIEPRTRRYPLHFIIGEELCRKQLNAWGISDVGLKTDLGGRLIGHIDGLL